MPSCAGEKREELRCVGSCERSAAPRQEMVKFRAGTPQAGASKYAADHETVQPGTAQFARK
eukprot:8482199-Alexandrium_andersonii.AAC.1